MRILSSNPNVDQSDLVNFPDGRIKDNDGSGNGTGINERTNGDIHQTISRLMRKYGIVPNGLPDNVTNGYQIVEAIQALASKNDFVLALTDVGGVLSVPIKFSFMDENESVICKSGINLASQTQIKGSDATTFNVTYVGSFKNNEYVRVIKTDSGVTIVRLADAVSLDAMVTELNFLKKATQTEENAGAIDTVATTPLSNKTTFMKRVNGVDSDDYLAKPTGDPDERNGLLSKEDKATIDSFVSKEVNYGTFTGTNFDDDPINTNYAVTGSITSAKKVENTQHGGLIEVVFANSHSDHTKIQLIYGVKFLSNYEDANYMSPLVWESVNSITIRIYIERPGGLATVQIQLQTNQR
jgi:hypothetical protein